MPDLWAKMSAIISRSQMAELALVLFGGCVVIVQYVLYYTPTPTIH